MAIFWHLVWVLSFLIVAVMLIRAIRVGGTEWYPAIGAAIVFCLSWHWSSINAAHEAAKANAWSAEAEARRADEAAIDADDRVAVVQRNWRADVDRIVKSAMAKVSDLEAKASLANIRAKTAEDAIATTKQHATELEGKVHALEGKLATRRPTVAARCPLSASDARSLRGIAGAPASR